MNTKKEGNTNEWRIIQQRILQRRLHKLRQRLPGSGSAECAVLTIFPAPNQKEYIALLPLDENGENEDGEVYLYRYYEENGQPNLDNIDSDEEYEIAADAFDELMDTEQFNEMEENSTEE